MKISNIRLLRYFLTGAIAGIGLFEIVFGESGLREVLASGGIGGVAAVTIAKLAIFS